jgi:predicted nuclease of predicted toxin-antitoxin system
MKVWLDAQLPPALAPWLGTTFGVTCQAVRDLGLRVADDQTIFQAARDGGEVPILSKDSDFVDLVLRAGHAPPAWGSWLTNGAHRLQVSANILMWPVPSRGVPAAW